MTTGVDVSLTYLGFKFVALELLEKVGLHFDLLGLLVSLHTNELGLFIA